MILIFSVLLILSINPNKLQGQTLNTSNLTDDIGQFQYRLEGSFNTRIKNEEAGRETINYNIKWNETSTEIQGIYQDNFFSTKPILTSGNVGEEGRVFNIILSNEIYGIKKITFKSTFKSSLNGSIPIKTTIEDNAGGVIDSYSSFSRMIVISENQNAKIMSSKQSCTVGFGALTNMCGIYGGTVLELEDSQNRCELINGHNPKLELTEDTSLNIIFDYSPGVQNPTKHELGSLLPSPTSFAINILKRNCSQLAFTTFKKGQCRELNLIGNFSNFMGQMTFYGKYSIRDEVTGDYCSYGLNLFRDVTY